MRQRVVPQIWGCFCRIRGNRIPRRATLSHVQAQSWSIVEVPIGEATLNESVVFELSRPARILGYAVQFGYLPDSRTESLTVSLHPDFGYNGFDFWPSESLASVSRCGDDIGPTEWVEFILASPMEVEHPGLVHVVHQRTADGPALAFDGSRQPRLRQ